MKQPNLVFLADDDGDDREFFKSACSEVDNVLRCRTFSDGKSILDYLVKNGSELPDIIFMDINMPGKDGFQCLEEIRSIKHLRDLCIIIYSTSKNLKDIKKSYELGANGFVQKPNSFSSLKNLLVSIFETDWQDPCSRLDEHNFVLKPANYPTWQ